MSRNVNFIILQASVVFNQQISLFQEDYSDTKEGRNAAFRKAINKLKEKRAIRIKSKGTEYVLVYKVDVTEDILYCQLAKKTQMDTYKLTDNTIEQELIDSYPPLDVFINLKQQQFAIELNTKNLAASSIVTTVKNLINNLVKDYNIFFNTIENKKEFWSLLSNNEALQEITFDMIVPNFFGATGAANDLVTGAKSALNADSVSLTIKNKKGGLQASLEAIDSYVKYSSTAGSWKMKIKAEGDSKYKTINSTDCCIKKEIEAEILDLVKKIDDEWNIDASVYNGLINKLNGLFNYEE